MKSIWMRLLPILLVVGCKTFAADIVSFNMDGYFPMGENVRWAEDPRGHRQMLVPQWQHFSQEEIDQGHWVRLDELKESLQFISPDIVILQGVGAGKIDATKSCSDFYDSSPGDNNYINSALRLIRRLPQYKAVLSCQGEVVGFTHPDTYSTFKVVKKNGSGFAVVHEIGANPYPKGIFVKGLALLYRSPWEVSEVQTNEIIYNSVGDRVVVQFVKMLIPKGNGRWFLIVNVDLESNTIHFEQAVQIRRAINNFISSSRDRNLYSGFLVAGEFNNQLFRLPVQADSPVTIPWEVAVNDLFDFRSNSAPDKLLELLVNFNKQSRDVGFIKDPDLANKRLSKAIDDFVKFQEESTKSKLPVVLSEAVDRANRIGLCKPISLFGGTCSYPGRSDFIFVDENNIGILNTFIAFSSHSKSNLYGMSFHPAIYLKLDLK